MKPVNLLPPDVAVVAEPGKPNLGMIGGAIAGFVAVVGVAGYFAMARVDSIKSEAAAATARAAEATQQTTATRSQIESLGKPVADSDRELAQGAEAVLVAAYTERHDFVLLADDLRAIMDPGGWYEKVDATSTEVADGRKITITGYMPDEELAASFNERANATRTMANAELVFLESEKLRDLKSRREGRYYKFVVEADFVDTVAPSSSSDPGAGTSDATGLTVGAGGGGGQISLSLDSKPKPKPAAPAKPAKPKNPFDVAATMAGGGK